MSLGDFDKMEFPELMFQSECLERQKAENFNDNLIYAAFVGWQRMTMEGYKKKFEQYLCDLGLSKDNKKKIAPEERKRIAEKAYETGARVMNAFKGLRL